MRLQKRLNKSGALSPSQVKVSRALKRPPLWGYCPTPRHNRQKVTIAACSLPLLLPLWFVGLLPHTPQHAAESHHRGMFATAPAAALVRGATAPHPAKIGRVTPRRCSVPRWQFSTSGPSAIRFRWSRIAEDPSVAHCSALHYTAALRSNRYLLAAMPPAGFFVGWRLVDGETHFPHPSLFCALRIDFTEIERGRSVSGCPSEIHRGFIVCLRLGATEAHPARLRGVTFLRVPFPSIMLLPSTPDAAETIVFRSCRACQRSKKVVR